MRPCAQGELMRARKLKKLARRFYPFRARNLIERTYIWLPVKQLCLTAFRRLNKRVPACSKRLLGVKVHWTLFLAVRARLRHRYALFLNGFNWKLALAQKPRSVPSPIRTLDLKQQFCLSQSSYLLNAQSDRDFLFRPRYSVVQ